MINIHPHAYQQLPECGKVFVLHAAENDDDKLGSRLAGVMRLINCSRMLTRLLEATRDFHCWVVQLLPTPFRSLSPLSDVNNYSSRLISYCYKPSTTFKYADCFSGNNVEHTLPTYPLRLIKIFINYNATGESTRRVEVSQRLPLHIPNN